MIAVKDKPFPGQRQPPTR